MARAGWTGVRDREPAVGVTLDVWGLRQGSADSPGSIWPARLCAGVSPPEEDRPSPEEKSNMAEDIGQSDHAERGKPHGWRSFLGLAAYFTVLTVVATWPLVEQMDRAVIGRPGDNLYFVWLIGWFEKALVTLHVSPFTTSLLNYPQGWNLASSEISPLPVLAGLPFSIILNPVFGYNIVAMLTFILSGLGMYAWALRLGGDRWAAILAGTAFAFTPYRISHMMVGHLHVLTTMALPVFFLAVDEGLRPAPHFRRWAVAAGVWLGLIALGSQYYFYMTSLLAAIYIASHAWLRREGPRPMRLYSERIGYLLAGALPLALLAIAPFIAGSLEGAIPPRGTGGAIPYSASPTDYILPFTGHPLWGGWVGEHFDRSLWIEASLYPSVVMGGLAVLALVRSNSTPLGSRKTRHFALMAVAGFVFSLGVTLHWLSEPVQATLPSALGWLQAPDGTSILLPAFLAYKVLPYFASIRVPMRFAPFVHLFIYALAAGGAAWLRSRFSGRTRTFLAAGILALLIVDFLPPRMELSPVDGRPVDYWIGEQEAEGAVAQFPFDLAADSQEQIYYTLVHGRPYIGGLYTSFWTSQFEAVRPVLTTFPSAESIALLRELGVRYVVVDSAWYGERGYMDDIHNALVDLGLRPAVSLAGQDVYINE